MLRKILLVGALFASAAAIADGISGTVVITSTTITNALGFTPLSQALSAGHVYVGNGSNVGVDTAVGVGLAGAAGSLTSNANQQVGYQPGLETSIVNTKGAFAKFSKASTVDNLEGSASQFTCTVNPTITLFECGTSTTCGSPTTIGTVTITASGTVVDGSITSANITAVDYVAWAITAGACTVIDISGFAQVHSN